MTTPALRSHANMASGTGGLNPAYPAGIVAGDLLMMVVTRNTGGSVLTTVPSGWTKQVELPTGNSPSAAIATKVATGSESGTVSVTPDGSEVRTAKILCWQDVDTAAIFAKVPVTALYQSTFTTTTTSLQNVSTSGGSPNPDCLACQFWLTASQPVRLTADPTGESGGDWTLRYGQSNGTNNVSHSLVTAPISGSGGMTGGSAANNYGGTSCRAHWIPFILNGKIVTGLPSSGPLSLGDIAEEFGGATPHAISEYYAADTGVPASGIIKISDFYGKGA